MSSSFESRQHPLDALGGAASIIKAPSETSAVCLDPVLNIRSMSRHALVRTRTAPEFASPCRMGGDRMSPTSTFLNIPSLPAASKISSFLKYLWVRRPSRLPTRSHGASHHFVSDRGWSDGMWRRDCPANTQRAIFSVISLYRREAGAPSATYLGHSYPWNPHFGCRKAVSTRDIVGTSRGAFGAFLPRKSDECIEDEGLPFACRHLFERGHFADIATRAPARFSLLFACITGGRLNRYDVHFLAECAVERVSPSGHHRGRVAEPNHQFYGHMGKNPTRGKCPLCARKMGLLAMSQMLHICCIGKRQTATIPGESSSARRRAEQHLRFGRWHSELQLVARRRAKIAGVGSLDGGGSSRGREQLVGHSYRPTS